jgi:hypothetical protein
LLDDLSIGVNTNIKGSTLNPEWPAVSSTFSDGFEISSQALDLITTNSTFNTWNTYNSFNSYLSFNCWESFNTFRCWDSCLSFDSCFSFDSFNTLDSNSFTNSSESWLILVNIGRSGEPSSIDVNAVIITGQGL